MPTLPAELMALIVEFAPLFSKPVWEHAKVLLFGAILALGKRAVTSCLRMMGQSQEIHFQNYHRVLNRARWSALAASQILLRLLVATFAPRGELIFGIDAQAFMSAETTIHRCKSWAGLCGARGWK